MPKSNKFYDLLLKNHPFPEIYCSDCYMRKENCECQHKGAPEASKDAWALIPNGKGYQKPIHQVWFRRNACKIIKKREPIRPSDRMWLVRFSMCRDIVDQMGGMESQEYLYWSSKVLKNTLPMWHPVDSFYVGKCRNDFSADCVEHIIGRPREDWEYFEPKNIFEEDRIKEMDKINQHIKSLKTASKNNAERINFLKEKLKQLKNKN